MGAATSSQSKRKSVSKDKSSVDFSSILRNLKERDSLHAVKISDIAEIVDTIESDTKENIIPIREEKQVEEVEQEELSNKSSDSSVDDYSLEALEQKKCDSASTKSLTTVVDDEKVADIVTDPSKYALNFEHVHSAITEYSDTIDVSNDDFSATKLVPIFEANDISLEQMKLWNINSKNSGKQKLDACVKYAEANSSCPADIKLKLRVITKLILEDTDEKNESKKSDKGTDYNNILLLIASHGNVCNVMKNVAIDNAYATLTNTMSSFVESQSLQQQILKNLRDFRVLLIEKQFHKFKMCNNTHYVAGFHNVLAKDVGVAPYVDPNICNPSSSQWPNWKKGLKERYFATLYTKENILEFLYKQIDEKKISYQKIVKFFEENCPKCYGGEKVKFLQKVIDIDTGKIGEVYMHWMLKEMDIFLVKDEEWKEIEKCWED